MIFLFLYLTAILTSAQDDRDCGTSCLSKCREIAISCVRQGIKPSEYKPLMDCVYSSAWSETYREEGDDSVGVVCQECVDEQLKTLSFEEKAVCLNKGEVDSCTGIDSMTDCNYLFQSQGCDWQGGKCVTVEEDDEDEEGGDNNEVVEECSGADSQDECDSSPGCGWLGGKCHDTIENGLGYNKYKELMASFSEDECRHLGGKFRSGSCKAKHQKKVKCGNVNRGKKKASRDLEKSADLRLRDCPTCQVLCEWLPKCEYKPRVNRCKGSERPFADEN